jgi:hypothetical protein
MLLFREFFFPDWNEKWGTKTERSSTTLNHAADLILTT